MGSRAAYGLVDQPLRDQGELGVLMLAHAAQPHERFIGAQTGPGHDHADRLVDRGAAGQRGLQADAQSLHLIEQAGIVDRHSGGSGEQFTDPLGRPVERVAGVGVDDTGLSPSGEVNAWRFDVDEG